MKRCAKFYGLLVLTGPVSVTTKCRLVAAGGVIWGTLSVTKTELYFEMDEDHAENKAMPPSVRNVLSRLWCYIK